MAAAVAAASVYCSTSAARTTSSSTYISPLIFSAPRKPVPLLHTRPNRAAFLLRPRRLSPQQLRFSGNNNNNNNNNEDVADAGDRILSAACYFYPFLDGVQYGRFVLTQFPAFQLLLSPLFPAIRLFRSWPLTPLLLFLTLYFAVVRNPGRFSRFVRFNTMQAIALDVLLIFPDLLDRSIGTSGGGPFDPLLQSFDSTVFFFLLASLVYGSSSSLLGRLPRLPIVADAADRQVM